MEFYNKCEHHFPELVRNQGERLHQNSKVKVFRSQLEEVGSTVYDGQDYKVLMRWMYFKSYQGLEVSCDCFEFKRFDYCPHSWATIIAVNNDLFPEAANSLEKIEVTAKESTIIPTQPSVKLNLKQDFTHSTLKSLERAINKKKVLKEQLTQSNKAPQKNEIFYLIDTDSMQREDQLRLSFNIRETKKDGSFSKLKVFNYTDDKVEGLSRPEDKKILTLLRRFNSFETSSYWKRQKIKNKNSLCEIPTNILETILPLIERTNRLAYLNAEGEAISLRWNPTPLNFHFDVKAKKETWEITGHFKDPFSDDENEQISMNEIKIILGPNIIIHDKELRLVNCDHLHDLMSYLDNNEILEIPKDKQNSNELKSFLSHTTGLEKADVPEELNLKHKYIKPKVQLEVHYQQSPSGHDLWGEFFTFYNDQKLIPFSSLSLIQTNPKHVYVKDEKAEYDIYNYLRNMEGLQFAAEDNYDKVRFDPMLFSDTVATLWKLGVEVKGEGKRIIAPDSVSVDVKPQQDWFEIRSKLSFNRERLPQPVLLRQAKEKSLFVSLNDKESGVLPLEWLQKQLHLTSVAIKRDKNYYIHKSMSLFVEKTIENEIKKKKIPGFTEIIKKIKAYNKAKPIPVSKNFNGVLRPYQNDSMKWLNFLDEMSIGGCLADDMGLGKTVQVLAWLQTYKEKKEIKKPHLIICPKSLIFNWKNEANKYCPEFNVKVYAGHKKDRLKQLDDLKANDILIMSYGTLRRDIEILADIEFEYTILDEAQAIKNENSQTSKACCLINTYNRLALTGTPVENHFGELFSLFKFLNPGLFGVKISKSNFEGGNEVVVKNILRGLKPFILRRTKSEVLDDLPDKTESFLICEMEEKQADLYKELETYYQSHLNKKVKTDGIKRTKIHILEALLRMRQAACHPRLIHPDFAIEESSKLKMVIEKLKQLHQAGHKALIFSQFTTLLKILGERLKEEGIDFSYLDGQTNKREEVVEEFKQDDNKSAFLISIKAGGFGLNLTEANYCFILDPWWNPAVEEQAIDRTHRIGQKQKVTAYRVISKGTVEEKILDLQKNKKDLAKQLMFQDGTVLSDLSLRDFDYLFG
jgi:superfamily II DNA or RNA helicase